MKKELDSLPGFKVQKQISNLLCQIHQSQASQVTAEEMRYFQIELDGCRLILGLSYVSPHGCYALILYLPSPFLSIFAVKFEDCLHSREVGFFSNDPNFSVRPDGTVYAEQEVANLSEPVQFMVTAKRLRDPRVWETTVKLALAGHPHPLALSKVMRFSFT